MKNPREIRIFLASPNDLGEERDAVQRELEGNLRRLYRPWGFDFGVDRWEEGDRSYSTMPKQEEITARMLSCDAVFFLVNLRIGQYTLAEFDAARNAVARNHPIKLCVFFKTTPPANLLKGTGKDLENNADALATLAQLRKTIESAGQIHDEFDTIDALRLAVGRQLRAMFVEPTALDPPESSPPAAADPGPRFGSPPTPVPVFVNREETLRRVIEALKNGRIVHLKGVPGVGKTELATVIADRIKAWCDDRVVFFQTFHTRTLSDLLGEVSLAFERREAMGDMSARKLRVQRLLSRLDGRALIVLDDVVARQQAELLEFLAVRGPTPVLLTSRSQEKLHVPGEEEHLLQGLEESDGITLLRTRCDETMQTDWLRDVFTAVSGIPQMLVTVAGMLRGQATPSDVVEWLRRDAWELMRHEDRVRAMLDYSYSHLSPEEQHLFACLGAFGAETFTARALAAVSGDQRTTMRLHFSLMPLSLVRAHFLPGRYFVHPLIKSFAESRLREAGSRDALSRMVDYYKTLATEGRVIEELRLEKGNLLAAIHHAGELGDDSSVVALVAALNAPDAYYGWFGRSGYWMEAIDVLHRGAQASARVAERGAPDPFRRLEASFLRDIGQFHYWLGNHREARVACREARERFSALGDRPAVIGIQHILGYIEDDENRYDEARRLYEEALNEALEIGDSEQIALGHHLVGVIDYHQGRYQAARGRYTTCLELTEALGLKAVEPPDRRRLGLMIARCERRFAALARREASSADAGRRTALLDEAMDRIGRALATERHERSRSFARALRQHGMILEEQGDIPAAAASFRQALEVFEEVGNLKGIGAVHYNLGSVALAAGDLQEAERSFVLSGEVARQVASVYGQAMACHGLGDLARRQGNISTAIAKYRECQKLFTSINSYLAASLDCLLETLGCNR